MILFSIQKKKTQQATNITPIQKRWTSSSSLSTNTRKLLTRKRACHTRLLPIHLHIHMWVVYLHMIHVDIQLKAYMWSNFHQTSHQSTCENYQNMSCSANCALCQMFWDYSKMWMCKSCCLFGSSSEVHICSLTQYWSQLTLLKLQSMESSSLCQLIWPNQIGEPLLWRN